MFVQSWASTAVVFKCDQSHSCVCLGGSVPDITTHYSPVLALAHLLALTAFSYLCKIRTNNVLVEFTLKLRLVKILLAKRNLFFDRSLNRVFAKLRLL